MAPRTIGDSTTDKSSPEKSDRAFRTISEAAEAIGVPQHVLRFWETRFPQLQPLKRGGNRRYYRPADMALLANIRTMLHDEGLTIRGAQLALAGGKERVRAAGLAPDAMIAAQAIAVEMPVAPGPTAFVVDRTAQALPAPSAPPLDLAALRAIRDRLRLALAA